MTTAQAVPSLEALKRMTVGELRDLRRRMSPPWPSLRLATKAQLVENLTRIAQARAMKKETP